MATSAQIQANRQNALRSTGPRTEDGKSASRFNALKHGIDARSLVIPGEDPADLEDLIAEYQEQFSPVGPLERYLVETIIQADWHRRRYNRMEAPILTSLLCGEVKPGALAVALGCNSARNLFRRLAAVERAYFIALKELRRAQRDRQAQEAAAAPAPTPGVGPGIGFVPPKEDTAVPPPAAPPESPRNAPIHAAPGIAAERQAVPIPSGGAPLNPHGAGR